MADYVAISKYFFTHQEKKIMVGLAKFFVLLHPMKRFLETPIHSSMFFSIGRIEENEDLLGAFSCAWIEWLKPYSLKCQYCQSQEEFHFVLECSLFECPSAKNSWYFGSCCVSVLMLWNFFCWNSDSQKFQQNFRRLQKPLNCYGMVFSFT